MTAEKQRALEDLINWLAACAVEDLLAEQLEPAHDGESPTESTAEAAR